MPRRSHRTAVDAPKRSSYFPRVAFEERLARREGFVAVGVDDIEIARDRHIALDHSPIDRDRRIADVRDAEGYAAVSIDPDRIVADLQRPNRLVALVARHLHCSFTHESTF